MTKRGRRDKAIPPEQKDAIGTKIRIARQERQIHLRAFAAELGISAAYLSLIETNVRTADEELIHKIIDKGFSIEHTCSKIENPPIFMPPAPVMPEYQVRSLINRAGMSIKIAAILKILEQFIQGKDSLSEISDRITRAQQATQTKQLQETQPAADFAQNLLTPEPARRARKRLDTHTHVRQAVRTKLLQETQTATRYAQKFPIPWTARITQSIQKQSR